MNLLRVHTPKRSDESGYLHRELTPRSAFTLIEVLVVVSVLLILMTITLSMIRSTSNADKLSAAARQMQAYLEGARSRAFQSRAPVGVRFLIDEDDPTTVSSFVYVEPAPPETGTLTISSSNQTRITQQAGVSWTELANNKLLKPGNRIKIGSNYYYVTNEDFDSNVSGSPPRLNIAPAFKTGSLSNVTLSYELELSPIVSAGVEPVKLPKGLVIDLDSSSLSGHSPSFPNQIPTSLYSGSGKDWTNALTMTLGEKISPTNNNTQNRQFVVSYLTGNRQTGATEPNWDSFASTATITDGNVKYTIIPADDVSFDFDLLFAPTGALTGDSSQLGIVRFVIAEKVDTDQGRDILDVNDLDGRPRGEMILFTINARSGSISVSPVDLTNTDGDASKFDNPFNYADNGVEAKN